MKHKKPFDGAYRKRSRRRSRSRIFFTDYILIMEKIFPNGFSKKEYAMEDKVWILYLRHLSSLASDFQNIDKNTTKHLGKIFQNMSLQEQKQFYKKDSNMFQEKYKILAKLEAFQTLLVFVNPNFEKIFPVLLGLGLKKQHCLKWLQERNSFYLKSLKTFSFLVSDLEKIRISCMELNMQILNEKIEKLLYEKKKLYHDIFFLGTAKKVDIFGVRQIICSYIGT
jgi:hypothetical protein